MVSSEAQVYFINGYGHDVWMDVVAIGDDKTGYDFELQRDKSKAPVQRQRYYGSFLDVTLLPPGADWDTLPERYTIWFYENDFVGDGEPIHEYEYRDKKTNKPLNDGSHIVIVNRAYEGTDDLGVLMHDFHCTSPDDMQDGILRERCEYLKNTEGGRKEVDDIYRKEIDAEVAARVYAEKVDMVKNAYKNGILPDVIATVTKFSVEKVREILGLQMA